ncbi:MAG: signal peptidase II [Alphaproteobacteria bacterium]|nr:MAG: signal peptidase II [Alphaproteobacteria bacterium]
MFRFGLFCALGVIILDQVSKFLLIDVMTLHPEGIEITPFFHLVMVWNRGVSFGMFAGHDMRWALVALSLAISVAILFWLRRAHSRFLALCLGFILGGAIGNVIDRVRLGAVADFFDFDLYFMRWPAFNVADMAIVCGVVLILVESLFQGRKADKLGS